MVTERSTEAELARALSVIARRENIVVVYEDLAARAGLDLSPGDCWLLLRLRDHTPVSTTELAARLRLPDQLLGPHLDRLITQGDLARSDGRLVLTDSGGHAAERLVESRSAQLAALLGDMPAEERDQHLDLLHRLAASLLAAPAGKTLLATAR